MLALASTTKSTRSLSIRAAQRSLRSTRRLSTLPVDNPPFAQAVVLEYEKLRSGHDYSQEIEKAYGKDGLGLLVVSGIPGYYALRQRLLPMIHKFANLPVEQRTAMEHPQGYVGWAHGKEKLGATGEPDLLKANYKANPQYNIPTMDQNLIKQYPEYCTPNMWPTKTMPQFEDAFMSLGQTVVAVGFLIAKQCDRFIKKRVPDWPTSGKGSMFQTLTDSYTCKARALHYYPPPALDPKMDQLRDWCGWHNDHGSLTGLTSAMYIDKHGNEVQNPDPRAGLVVAPRKGSPYPEHVKVAIPPEALAFQIGECSQLVSGGHLQATPHMVKGPSNPDTIARGISRSTFAVFMQPGLHDKVDLPKGSTADAIEASPWVPDLRSRYTPGQDFITFTKSTLAKYYEFEQQKAKQMK